VFGARTPLSSPSIASGGAVRASASGAGGAMVDAHPHSTTSAAEALATKDARSLRGARVDAERSSDISGS
jgi:hypothetical protein